MTVNDKEASRDIASGVISHLLWYGSKLLGMDEMAFMDFLCEPFGDEIPSGPIEEEKFLSKYNDQNTNNKELFLYSARTAFAFAGEALSSINNNMPYVGDLSRAHHWLGFCFAIGGNSDKSLTHRELSKRGADARHTENREQKARMLAWYAENRHRLKNKDEAALEFSRLEPVAMSTVRRWLKGI